MEIKKRTSSYYINLNAENFVVLTKVLKLVFNDLQELLRIYNKELNIVVTPEDVLKFQKIKIKYDLHDADFIKFLFNLYHLVRKNQKIFDKVTYSNQDEDQKWHAQWEEFREALHISQGKMNLVKNRQTRKGNSNLKG
jgi:hypothetical protein